MQISSGQPKSTPVSNILLSLGNNGNSAIFIPILVNNPSSSKAPKLYNYSNELIKVYTGGGSIKSKLSRSFMPIAFNYNTVWVKLVLWISGTLVGNISCL